MDYGYGLGVIAAIIFIGVVIANVAPRIQRERRARARRGPDRLALIERMPLEYITDEFVRHEQNAEVRSILLRRLGMERWAKMFGMSKSYIHDEFGEIWQDSSARYRAVVVENSTPNPDGTRKKYWLRLPGHEDRQPPRFCHICGINIATRDFDSARAAVAWTFGLCAAHYAPVTAS